jgi:hypothetical protein
MMLRTVDTAYDNDELYYLRIRLGELIQCIPIEEFSPCGVKNTNYNQFISDLVQYESVIVINHIDTNKVSVVMFSENEPTPHILVFDKKEPAV